MWRGLIRQQTSLIFSRRATSSLSAGALRERLKPYLEPTSYVDELTQALPKLNALRRASILVPVYVNERTSSVDVLLLKRSDKVRSHTGMIAFPGGMTDPTDRDAVHTAEREAEEEIGLRPEHYAILGCLPPIVDARPVMITPVVALLHSPKFSDFRLAEDEIAEAFYLDLAAFISKKHNYRMREVGRHFVTHHFDVGSRHVWGVTAFELIVLGALVFRQLPEFAFFRHGHQLDLQAMDKQLKAHFRLCVNAQDKAAVKAELDEISRCK